MVANLVLSMIFSSPTTRRRSLECCQKRPILEVKVAYNYLAYLRYALVTKETYTLRYQASTKALEPVESQLRQVIVGLFYLEYRSLLTLMRTSGSLYRSLLTLTCDSTVSRALVEAWYRSAASQGSDSGFVTPLSLLSGSTQSASSVRNTSGAHEQHTSNTLATH